MDNYPIGADKDIRAPFNESDIVLCPNCGEETEIIDGYNVCTICKWSDEPDWDYMRECKID